MEDEDYSYGGYSEQTLSEMSGRQAKFIDNDEVFTYYGYADEKKQAEQSRAAKSYGDSLVDEFSAATNVPRVSKFTGIPQNVVACIFAVAYLAVGITCVVFTRQITSVLPYIVGSLMIVIGLWRFVYALIRKEYRSLETNHTATSVIIIALGIMIILEHLNPESNWAITFISIIWGVYGLFEGAHAFNHAFKRMAHSERWAFYLIKGIVECVVAFMLLYQPDDHDIHHFHIIVFGVNLIFDSIVMFPPIKSFLSKK